jgi:N-acetyl-alpha-D-muramate 1-phosphate uridylyltransferase
VTLAGVVLAAGRGRRLGQLTDLLPKPLCPIANRPMIDLAIEHVVAHTGDGAARIAVNAHYRSRLLRAHLGDRVRLSDEQPEALGTAGALGALRGWLDGRPTLLANSDAYLPGGLAPLLEGWDGQRIRLLCKDIGRPADFGSLRYVGACLMPWQFVEPLAAEPSGLYETVWRAELAAGTIDLVTMAGVAIDCGTPPDYLAANLHASGGASVLGAGAVVEGRLERCVVWPGAYVGPQERLVDAIRAGDRATPITVQSGAEGDVQGGVGVGSGLDQAPT